MTSTCYGIRYGVIIERDGQILLTTTDDHPGLSPVTGHGLGPLATGDESVSALVAAQTGLTVTHLQVLSCQSRHDQCTLSPIVALAGHEWHICLAEVTGEISAVSAAQSGAYWAAVADLPTLAGPIIAYANGHITWTEYTAAPGLAAIWVDWLCQLDYLTMDEASRTQLRRLSEHGPDLPEVWDPAGEWTS